MSIHRILIYALVVDLVTAFPFFLQTAIGTTVRISRSWANGPIGGADHDREESRNHRLQNPTGYNSCFSFAQVAQGSPRTMREI